MARYMLIMRPTDEAWANFENLEFDELLATVGQFTTLREVPLSGGWTPSSAGRGWPAQRPRRHSRRGRPGHLDPARRTADNPGRLLRRRGRARRKARSGWSHAQ
jgi:hypothetical protein